METFIFNIPFKIANISVIPSHIRCEHLRHLIPPHQHSNCSYELHYCGGGNGTLRVDDQIYPVHEGALFMTGPDLVHSQFSDPSDPVLEYCLYLNCDHLPGKTPFDLFLETNFWYTEHDTGLLPILNEILDEMRTPQPDCNEMVECLLRRVVIYLTRCYRMNPSESHVREAQNSSPKLYSTDIYLMLDEAFAYKYGTLTLEEVAEMLHLSVRQTQRFFKLYGSIIFFVGLTLPRYRFSKPSASLDMNLRQCVG